MKVLLSQPQSIGGDFYLRKWKEEIKIMKEISKDQHIKSIVKALDPEPEEILSMHEGFPILVMEYCDQGNLRQVSLFSDCCLSHQSWFNHHFTRLNLYYFDVLGAG